MEEKKNNKGLILLIAILIVLVLGLTGYIIYDKVLSKDKIPVNKSVTYCNKNKNIILKSISDLRNNSFNYKYNKDKFKIIELDNIDCERSEEYNENKLIIRVTYEISNNSYSETFVYDIKNSSINAYSELDGLELNYNEYIALDAFNYAKDMVSEDKEIYNISHPEFNLGTFKDKTYNGNNIYILKICEYEDEGTYCPTHYYDYEINFVDKTFKKINIDVE